MPNSQTLSARRIAGPLINQNYQGNPGNEGPGPITILVLIAVAVVAVVIIIALVISKRKRRQSTDSTDGDMELQIRRQASTESIELEEDPYLQAIMFPSEPEPEWQQQVRIALRSASQKILRKPEEPPHRTSIPEDLRHQLKHIYVY